MEYKQLHKFKIILLKLSEIYGQKMTAEAISAYWRVLEKFTLVEILFACKSHIHSLHGNAMPKPFDLAKKITRSRKKLVAEGIAK